jgi:hypothetical protein
MIDLFPSSGEGWEKPNLLGPSERTNQWLWLDLSKGPNRVGVSLPSPEDGNRSSFWNVVFSSIYNSSNSKYEFL